VTDIAPHNVELALLLGKHHGISLSGKVGDAEGLQFEDNTFDIVTCAGSLSYLDHSKAFAEIHRVLKEEGVFICVDSLNHNPLYRFNRWIHYLLGGRTKSTLLRMPTMRVFEEFEREIGPVVCRSFHGIFSFLIPLLKPLLGESTTGRVLDYLDFSFPALRSQAFKFVAVVQKRPKILPLKPS
jgi:SAM-dependent methyltransferase